MKWYHKPIPVILALILMGPFAFPLLWKSDYFNSFWKIVLTLAFTALTFWFIQITIQTSGELIKIARQLAAAEGIG